MLRSAFRILGWGVLITVQNVNAANSFKSDRDFLTKSYIEPSKKLSVKLQNLLTTEESTLIAEKSEKELTEIIKILESFPRQDRRIIKRIRKFLVSNGQPTEDSAKNYYVFSKSVVEAEVHRVRSIQYLLKLTAHSKKNSERSKRVLKLVRYFVFETESLDIFQVMTKIALLRQASQIRGYFSKEKAVNRIREINDKSRRLKRYLEDKIQDAHVLDGLPFEQMSPAQKTAAMAIIREETRSVESLENDIRSLDH